MGEKIHFVFFCGPEPRSASELLLAHVLFLTMQLQFLIKRLGDSVFVWAHTTEGDKSWMGKLKWLCSGSFIHESVHLRAINQELFAEGKKSLFECNASRWKCVLWMCGYTSTHFEIQEKPSSSVNWVHLHGCPTKTSNLKKLCYFRREKWPKVVATEGLLSILLLFDELWKRLPKDIAF